MVDQQNSTVNRATGYSPHFLLFGRHSHLPIDLMFGISETEPVDNSDIPDPIIDVPDPFNTAVPESVDNSDTPDLDNENQTVNYDSNPSIDNIEHDNSSDNNESLSSTSDENDSIVPNRRSNRIKTKRKIFSYDEKGNHCYISPELSE